MSGRIRKAAESVEREEARAREAMLTLTADSTAPNSPRARADHFRAHLVEAQRVIATLQVRVAELEKERDHIKRKAAYDFSLCVTRGEAERARLAAFRLAIEKAAKLFEGPDGMLTSASEAIRAIPEPQPKWSNR